MDDAALVREMQPARTSMVMWLAFESERSRN
jgi:hypothetical protein